jgi:hypothetical protein
LAKKMFKKLILKNLFFLKGNGRKAGKRAVTETITGTGWEWQRGRERETYSTRATPGTPY